jgi:hypothetical protein
MSIGSTLYEYSQAILEELAKYGWATLCAVAGLLCYANLHSLGQLSHSLDLQPSYGPCEVSAVMTTGPPHTPELLPIFGFEQVDHSVEGDAVYITTNRYRL